MRGPIDYIIVGFDGNNFKGEVLNALAEAMEKNIIDVLDISIITKDNSGEISSIELENIDKDLAKRFFGNKEREQQLTTIEDVIEVGELLENNCSAGLLVIEQLWAKDLKTAIIDADGVLLAEGRIHPDAYNEISNK